MSASATMKLHMLLLATLIALATAATPQRPAGECISQEILSSVNSGAFPGHYQIISSSAAITAPTYTKVRCNHSTSSIVCVLIAVKDFIKTPLNPTPPPFSQVSVAQEFEVTYYDSFKVIFVLSGLRASFVSVLNPSCEHCRSFTTSVPMRHMCCIPAACQLLLLMRFLKVLRCFLYPCWLLQSLIPPSFPFW